MRAGPVHKIVVLRYHSGQRSSLQSLGNVNDHRAAAIDLQAEKAARPAAPCASYCYPVIVTVLPVFWITAAAT